MFLGGEMPPDPPISFCTSRGSSYKCSVPVLCPSNGDVLATPLEDSGVYCCAKQLKLEEVGLQSASSEKAGRKKTLQQHGNRTGSLSDRIVSLMYKAVVHSLLHSVHANDTVIIFSTEPVYPLKNDCNRHFVEYRCINNSAVCETNMCISITMHASKCRKKLQNNSLYKSETK